MVNIILIIKDLTYCKNNQTGWNELTIIIYDTFEKLLGLSSAVK